MTIQFNKNFLILLFIFYPFFCLANEDISNAENWLNNISSMTADFIQISSDGGSAEGKIYIKKDHGFRFEYLPPSPLLVVGRGNWVIVQDIVENTSNNYPLSQTPFSRFLSGNVSLTPDGYITTSKKKGGILEIKIVSNEKEDSYLQLDFSLNPFQLRRWVIIDQIGTEIAVMLQNHRFDVELPAKTFRGMPISTE